MALQQHEVRPVLHLVLLLQPESRVAENIIHFHEEGKEKKLILCSIGSVSQQRIKQKQ